MFEGSMHFISNGLYIYQMKEKTPKINHSMLIKYTCTTIIHKRRQ